MKILFPLQFLMFSVIIALADSGQVIKGKVVDAQSHYPIPGVNVLVMDSDPIKGTTTDSNGKFYLENVEFGRISLRFTFIGYEDVIISSLLVNAGKEVVVEIKMEEKISLLEGITVNASDQGEKGVMNEMATVSARGFNVAETERYAGSRNDPARMAANFAGVSGVNDGRNDIIIRGNSPTGLLWRLEGLDIPSPNHFAGMGATGGPVTILNNNLLSNSEFYTGAFPAMYGNAVSGVFDLSLRNGNTDKHEHVVQMGFNGIELGTEGPISKSSGSSYLINYRYSIPALMQEIGLSTGTGAAIPYYQDLSFKLNLPTKNGRWSVFGLGGSSHIDLLGSETTAEEAENDLYGDLDLDIYNTSKTGVAGISNLVFLNQKTYLKNSFAISGTEFVANIDTVMRNQELEVTNVENYVNNDYSQVKYTYNSQFNRKINAQHTITAGLIADFYTMDLKREVLNRFDQQTQLNEIGYDGNTSLWQGYLAWQYRLNGDWTLNSGLHYQQLILNDNSKALEPRMGLKYQFTPTQSLNFGYGRHNQMQGLTVYFVKTPVGNGDAIQTNRDLGFTRSDQFVLGYDNQFTSNLKLRVEAYYQTLDRVPVEQRSSYFSMLNAGADFGLPDTDSLVNEGTGRNYGLEVTLEKYLSAGYYFLLTGSFFDSKYKGSDGISRNTVFNGNHVVNALFGKEWKIGKKNNTFSADLKVTSAGNRRFIPVDLEASSQENRKILNYNEIYEQRFADYFRADVKLTFRINHRKIAEEYSLDVQNVTNYQNVFNQSYNVQSGKVGTTYQLGIWPMFQYRLLF